VTAEKPLLTIMRKLLQVKLVDGKPVFHEGHVILIDDHERESLLKART
jgi:hypothetical protein